MKARTINRIALFFFLAGLGLADLHAATPLTKLTITSGSAGDRLTRREMTFPFR